MSTTENPPIKALHISDTADYVLDRMKVRMEYPDVHLTQTGLAEVDKLISMDAGTHTVLAAREGAGKSVLATQIAKQWAVEGECLYYLTEMEIEDFVLRIIAAHAQRDFAQMRKAPTMEDFEAARQTYQDFAATGLRFVPSVGRPAAEVVEHARACVEQLAGPIRGVIVDNLLGLTAARGLRRDNANVWYGDIIQTLDRLKFHPDRGGVGAPLLTVHHLNRESLTPEGPRRPHSGQVAGSDVINRLADNILLLHPMANAGAGDDLLADLPLEPPPTHEILVEKNRNGVSKVGLNLRFIGRELRFEEVQGATPKPYEMPAAPTERQLERQEKLAAIPPL